MRYGHAASAFVVLNLMLGFSPAMAENGDRLAPLNLPASGSQPSPSAPDGGLGTAILTARVDIDGSLIGGAGATGAAIILTGQYEVAFNRDVSGCFYSAVSFQTTVPTFIQPRSGNPSAVFVAFASLASTSANPNFANSSFYLTVYCAK